MKSALHELILGEKTDTDKTDTDNFLKEPIRTEIFLKKSIPKLCMYQTSEVIRIGMPRSDMYMHQW